MDTQISGQPVIQHSMGWLKRIPSDLFSLDKKPLIGDPPPFSWNEFAQELASNLKIANLSIEASELQWRSPEDLFSGLGEPVRGLSIGVVPVEGHVWWAMPERELSHLIDSLVVKKATTTANLIDRDFISIFYRFLAVEALNAFEKIHVDKKLATTVAEGENLPVSSALCMDISIKIQDKALTGRLFLSPEFRDSWVKRYQQPTIRLNSPAAETLDVIVHLEAGRINLKTSEWKTVAPGDFIILDKCSLDPSEDKGKVLLVIAGIPFFRAKIKQNTLKILEHPLHYEVDTSMGNKPNTPSNDVDLGDDFDFDDLPEDLSGAKSSATTQSQTNEELEDLNFEDEENHPEKVVVEAAKPKSTPSVIKENNESSAPMHLEDIPLPVIVEVGRLQLSIKKLLELQPGNMLDLDIHPDASVDLVVHGKRIARAELLRIGESLGVRILEIS